MVLTSSVHVSAFHTALTDAGERAAQYMDSILFYIRESPFTNIIVCDNSGYCYPESLYELAASYRKRIELLSFTGSQELVALYGKGYGEGAIMEYVWKNSTLIREVEGFWKVTGRLKLVNIARLLRESHYERNYFMPVSLLRPRWLVPKAARPCVDLRAYYTTKIFFTEVLITAYHKVREREVYFLEHAWHDAMAVSPVQVQCFSTAPEFNGMSGSNGWVFKERSWWKKRLVKLVSLLGYIRPVYK